MNKAFKAILFIIMVAGLIFAGYNLFREADEQKTEVIRANEDTQTEEKKEVALPVRALTIKRGNLPLRLNISATADVWEKATLKAEVAGKVEKISYSVGDWARKGSLLIKLDDEERKLDVRRQEAEKLRSYSQYLVKEDTDIIEDTSLSDEQKQELDLLKKRYLQAVTDFAKNKISRDAFDAIDDAYQKALVLSGELREDIRRAQEGLSGAIVGLKQAQLNLKRTSLLAPFPGMVAEILASKGEKVSVGQELMRVVNLKSLYLKGFALESEIQHLRKGTRVRIRFDSYPDQYHYGEIQSISPEVHAEQKTITVYVKVDNNENHFLPGMHAEVDVEYKVRENVVKVPRVALLTRQDRYLVFVVKDLKGKTGVANWVYVEVGRQNDEEIEIKSGLQEGDLVLVDGHFTLAHQSRVKITN